MSANRDMKILIIDDMANMRRTIKNMLRFVGFINMAEARNGEEALKMIRDFEPDFLVLDWNMPRMPGIEVVQRVRENKETAELPILMITAEVMESQIVQAAESDIDGYIIKPFIAKTLEEKINSIIERKNSPSEFDLMIKGGINFCNGKQYDKAIDVFNKALEISPNSARVRQLIGQAYDLKGDTQKAEELFKEAAKINPQYIKVHKSLGDLYKKTGQEDKAVAALEQAAKISPNNTKRQSELGKIYLEKGDVGKAEKAFKIAIQVEPNNPSLKTNIGEMYLASGHPEKAADAFKGSLSLKEDVNVYNRLGIALRRKGKVQEAIGEYKKALNVDPRDEVLHYNIGRAYIEAKDMENAIQYFRKALKIDPDFEDAKVILKKIGG